MKIRSRRKKEKLPSGITADYSAEFFAHMTGDKVNTAGSAPQDADGLQSFIDKSSIQICNAKMSCSDSSEASLHSIRSVNNKRKMQCSSDLVLIASPSASVDSLDTTNSSFATPPFSLSPVGECQGIYAYLYYFYLPR